MKMTIDTKITFKTVYICEITKTLDEMAGMDSDTRFHHYIYAEGYYERSKTLAIRVPGGTVGTIFLDDNDVIIQIIVDTDYTVKTYPLDVNEQIKKFVGVQIEIETVQKTEKYPCIKD